MNEEDRWYEKFEERGTPHQDLANGGGKRFLERVESLGAADLLKGLEPQDTIMLSEEITRMAETELQSCEIERQKPEEIKEVSSDEPLSDKDDEQINGIGMHKKIHRNIKYDFFLPSLRRMTLFQSEGHWKERNCLMMKIMHGHLCCRVTNANLMMLCFCRQFLKSIEKIARLLEMVGYRHVRWNSSDTLDFLTRERKNFANNSDEEIQIENKQDSDASKDNSNIPAKENKERQDFNCANNEEAENNKEGSNNDVLSISANNMEETEQDNNSRENKLP